MLYAVLILIALIAILLIYAATRPDTLTVQRTTNIKAPPEKIFALINDFQRWSAWSPYEKKDPAMKRTFSGAASGTGAAYDFAGNNQVGAGRLEIIDTAAPSKVTLTLDMLKPMKGHNIINFTLEPRGDATTVTWAMRGASPYIARIIGVFLNMDRMIGGDFEVGLANLKAVAEQ